MKLSAKEFRELFQKSGGKMTSKGRPIIDMKTLYPSSGLPGEGVNKKVRGATKVFDLSGELEADSKWEFRCKSQMIDAGLSFDFQKTFLLLPTIRREGLPTLRKRTWTPDFTFEREKIVADAKGHTTEVAKLKIHLFLHTYPDWDVVILKTQSELLTFINKIKQKRNE